MPLYRFTTFSPIAENNVPFDDERALDAVATIWEKAVYWRPEPG